MPLEFFGYIDWYIPTVVRFRFTCIATIVTSWATMPEKGKVGSAKRRMRARYSNHKEFERFLQHVRPMGSD